MEQVAQRDHRYPILGNIQDQVRWSLSNLVEDDSDHCGRFGLDDL